MTNVLVTLVFLVTCGLMPALACGMTPVAATVVSPLMTAILSAAAATLSVATTSSFVFCFALVLVVTNAIALGLLCSRRCPLLPCRPSFGSLALPAVAIAVVLLGVRKPPTDWDTRSIWFFHAQWFWKGGDAAADAMGNKAFVFSHPDYPPLIPATVAARWSIGNGGFDMEQAQLVVALLMASGLFAVTLATHLVLASMVGRRRLQFVAAVLVLAAAGIGGAFATNGYGDLLWSVSFVAGAAILLTGPERSDLVFGLVLVTAAMLTKNEGMIAGGAVLLLLALPFVRPPIRKLTLAAPLALTAAWVMTALFAGADSDLAGAGQASALFRFDPSVWSRLRPTLDAIWAHTGSEILAAAAVTLVAFVVASPMRGIQLQRQAVAWAVFFVLTGSVLLAYLISPYDLRWHLDTSILRTTIAARLWLLTTAVFNCMLLIDHVEHRLKSAALSASPPNAF